MAVTTYAAPCLLVLSAVLVVLLCPSPAEANVGLSGFSAADGQYRQPSSSHRLSTLSTVQKKRGNPLAGHHPIVPGVPPCIPTKGLGHHPPGSGHHPPGSGGKPCAGHHPPAGTPGGGGGGHHPPGSGHHPPGSGHHATGGHHPPGHGHHCSGNASICLDPALTPPGFTQCCQ